MPSRDAGSVLVLSLGPYPNATRTRKAARTYAEAGFDVRFLGQQRAGRAVDSVGAGTIEADGVIAHHVKVTVPDFGSSKYSQVRNVVRSFGPAFGRMLSVALRSPADVVHVTGVHLVPVAIAHQLRFGSKLIADINERPASVKAKGSVFGALSRFEPGVIRAAVPRASVVTVVAPGHAEMLRESYGVESAVVVRNAPLSSWRHAWTPLPAGPPLRVVTVGGMFPGRALEMLIRAAGRVRRLGGDVRISIYGSGRPEYVASLEALIEAEQVGDLVTLEGQVHPSEVSETYSRAHIGLALYEAADPGNDSLSNKIIEVVASGRPVLAGDLPENRAFVREHGVGWLTAVTEENIAEALLEIGRLQHGEIEELADHCYRTADSKLTWKKEFGVVLDRVDTLLAHHVGRHG